VEAAFSFRMRIRSGYPIDAVRVPNGQAVINDLGNGEWEVLIDSSTGNGASTGDGLDDASLRDIIVYWRLAKDLPGAVDLVTYRKPGATQGSFMLTITPGVDLAPITEGRDWLFVLDTSGSMAGKFHTLADGVSKTIQALKTGDRFRVITFSDKARSLSRQSFVGYIAVNN